MTDEQKRYRLFGWDYPRRCPLDDRQVAWYRRFALDAPGGVLEPAGGTGRLAAALARAGAEVVGLDLTDEMLALARHLARTLPPEARARLRFIRGDMRNFDLARTFGLVVIADNSFRELNNRPDQLACLTCAAGHLAEGGRLLVTIRRFDPSLYPGGVRRIGWSDPVPHPRTGAAVSRRSEVRLVDGGRTLRGVMVYRTVEADGAETIEECPFVSPVMLTDDYLRLFAEAGLAADVHVGYETRPDDGRDPILNFVCSRA